MKPIFTLFLVLTACYATAQVTVDFGGGFSNRGKLVTNIEVGYQLKKMNFEAGYLVSVTDNSEIHDLFFVKAAKRIKLTRKSNLDIGTGIALHTYKREEINQFDHRYTYLKTINAGKPLVSINYQKRVISDGAFYTQVVYSDKIFYATMGLTYFFKQKKKTEKGK